MTWAYLPVVNTLLQVLATIGIGGLCGVFGVFKPDEFVPQAVRFVFYVALPCLVTKGIGIGIDFYSEKNIWSYIVAFLILRAISLILAVLAILFTNWREKQRREGIGHVAVLWLTLTWISTVIMGVPISSAVFGNPQLGQKYGILAGISSFIFQLPLQLMFLECHAAEENALANRVRVHSSVQKATETGKSSVDVTIQVTPDTSIIPSLSKAHDQSDQNEAATCTEEKEKEEDVKWWSLVQHGENISSARLWGKIGLRILRNPVLWGIFCGFVLSLSTAGKYLRCPSEYCVEGLNWINLALTWLGQAVSPVSLFAMGLWMHGQGTRKLFSIGIFKLSMFMVSKLILVPIIMVGLANAMRLNDEQGRAAILIATLPISLASFSLGRQYQIGESDLAANVACGTLLMLPTVLVWNIVLDKAGLYPIAV
mmetsp:Transcript_3811/g.6601  ORF Transcript_3811/g.6601 Transcript_3811/m.6601 type:complete len:426 (-) Transcript_3811:24-1301(-)|eukprot:CAMPEP_0197717894 /NCGR_PEP_ID=MMETSP1434-20131217/2260_1 /TAXON_ID=265543 /ORGANISM="Minutocellus polymorphus, Strain CCMP3303" /LENGTH=425 /DNA_ID=CAMNT_0043302475 /DNA_START=70 /DNA_END=1347 /DNA_ORIENTATION=-